MLLLGGISAHAKPVSFNIPAQPLSDALLLLSEQSKCEILFSFDELSQLHSSAVSGRYETSVALELLLRHTGYWAQRTGDRKYAVSSISAKFGTITGRILNPDDSPASKVRITLPGAHQSTVTDSGGEFTLVMVPPGTYSLHALVEGYRPLQWENLDIEASKTLRLSPQTLRPPVNDPMQLEAFVVVDNAARQYSFSQRDLLPRVAAGNIDLPRSENDALPYKIYQRDQITRSGVIDLNDFLRRELLDSDASTLPPEQNGAADSFLAGSSNLNLRGFGADATIILVNGRRLPESSATVEGMLGAPDVNSIPLNLVQQIEVLPASASSIYNGNPVGGVINIVLRPNVNQTEIRTTYTNALGGYDAPRTSVSLLYGRSLFDNRLRLRLSASHAQALPPTESELGYHQANDRFDPSDTEAIYRETPNIRSAQGTPLFGPQTSSLTSVAPSSDGTGGLGAFTSREGIRNFTLFDPVGGFAVSPDSIDNPFGRRQKRQSYTLSVTYDAFPWLQLGIDSLYTKTVVNRGFDVFRGDLQLSASSPQNPFNEDILVSLNETAPLLGENYSEARLELFSSLFGALIKLPANWEVSADAQIARNVAHYRGIAGIDPDRWQGLVDRGIYNPLRDTQAFAPPQEFYDQALVYFGQRDQFSKLGDYLAVDTAIRVTNQKLNLPTGLSTVALGFDYRLTELADYTQQLTYADGSDAIAPTLWDGRTLERVSYFGELQTPVLPARLLPTWLEAIEADLAVRFITADTSRETNLAPTLGFKIDFSGGLTVRGSASISNRYPTSAMSRRVSAPSTGGPGVNYTTIYDPKRDQSYAVATYEDYSPDVIPEGAVTQTVGMIYRRGDIHRIRASLDFVDTRKENELLFLTPQTLLNLESTWPERITRAALPPGDSHQAGPVASVLTGLINVSSRNSQNWNASLDYTWMECLGGRLDAYARLVYFQKYQRQVLPGSPMVDELKNPDGTASGLMRYRSNFGTSWTGHNYGFGVDGRYYHSRILPIPERPSQGRDRIKPYWQYDLFTQINLGRWIPWFAHRDGLTAQLRINNIFDATFPKYANDPSGAGVQAYGDWRGRTYSLSVTARF